MEQIFAITPALKKAKVLDVKTLSFYYKKHFSMLHQVPQLKKLQ